jgi:hypothetical protein
MPGRDAPRLNESPGSSPSVILREAKGRPKDLDSSSAIRPSGFRMTIPHPNPLPLIRGEEKGEGLLKCRGGTPLGSMNPLGHLPLSS